MICFISPGLCWLVLKWDYQTRNGTEGLSCPLLPHLPADSTTTFSPKLADKVHCTNSGMQDVFIPLCFSTMNLIFVSSPIYTWVVGPIFHQGHGQLLEVFKRLIHWPLITLFLPCHPVLFSVFGSCPCRGPRVNPMDLSQGVSLWPCVSSWLFWPLGCLSPSPSKLSASPSLHLLALVGLAHPLLLGAPKDLILGLLLLSL